MTRPTRTTVAGTAFLDLRARANADGRPVDEYLTLYALEGFLDRLSRSRNRDRAGLHLVGSTRLVANYRLATLAPLRTVLDGFDEVAQPRWAAWRSKQKLQDVVPEHIDDLTNSLMGFADPILDGTAETLTWEPTARIWQPGPAMTIHDK